MQHFVAAARQLQAEGISSVDCNVDNAVGKKPSGQRVFGFEAVVVDKPDYSRALDSLAFDDQTAALADHDYIAGYVAHIGDVVDIVNVFVVNTRLDCDDE